MNALANRTAFCIQSENSSWKATQRGVGLKTHCSLRMTATQEQNFDRPSLEKIIEMIEAGEGVHPDRKDTSRLGREYLQVGYYMEIYFPQKNVRFIAVNDGVDSAVESSNDFNPSATGRTNSTQRTRVGRFAP